MITLQHAALFTMAMAERSRKFNSITINFGSEAKHVNQFEQELHTELPWVLLPDAIRAYVGPRQASHFEELPDGTDVSWMEYPDETTLKSLSKENVSDEVDFKIADGYPKCVIGEDSKIGEFDTRNWDHKHYNAIRCHLIQDIYLDTMIRELVDCTKRFKDCFKIRHNGEEIDGAELRTQVARFEQLGFIKLVGAVYKKTGLLLNREWFDTHVLESLKKAYPEDLAANTYKYMNISDELNDRINAHDFELTAEEKASVKISNNLEGDLDRLYANAFLATFYEL